MSTLIADEAFNSLSFYMIENIKFREVKCWFQQKLSSGIETNIKTTDKLLTPADKTTNFYKMGTSTYNDLLQKNITKVYKKVTILVPRAHDPFGLRQGSRPLAGGGTHLSEGLTGLAEKTKEQTIKQ